MLRSLALAFLGLLLLAGPASARSDGGGGRRAAIAKGGGAGGKAERALLLRRAVAVRPAGTCARASRGGRGAARCRGLVRAVSWSWAQDLPPALGVQAQDCPAGTMATLAEGHDDIVRCIPI